MVTLDHVIGFALREASVMDQLGAALRSDLAVANPYQRTIAEFAHDFLIQRRKLPASGDWEMWLESLPEGMQRDGCREMLGRLLAVDTSGFDPAYFAEQALATLRKAAAQVAKARLNALPQVEPDTFAVLAEKIGQIGAAHGLDEEEFPRVSDLLRDAPLRPPPEELIRRLAWRSRFTVLSGAPKLGKTTLVAEGCAVLTRAGAFLDSSDPPSVQGRVLWVGLDEAEDDTVQRFGVLSAWRARIRLYRPRPERRDLLSGLQRAIAAYQPDVIVIDSLIAWTRRVCREMPASGDAAAWAAVVRPLSDLAHDTAVAILALHHAKKTGGYRDSGEIFAAADVLVEMDRAPGDPPETRRFRSESRLLAGGHTTWTARRDATTGRYAFGSLTTAAPNATAPEGGLSPAQQHTLDALPAAGCSWSEWQKLAGVARNIFAGHLKVLRASERVRQDEAKRWHATAMEGREVSGIRGVKIPAGHLDTRPTEGVTGVLGL
jgi:hypothetical protein